MAGAGRVVPRGSTRADGVGSREVQTILSAETRKPSEHLHARAGLTRVLITATAALVLSACAAPQHADKSEWGPRAQLASTEPTSGLTAPDPIDPLYFGLVPATQLVQADEAVDDLDFADDEDFFPTPESLGQEEIYDPLETLNRFMFAINETLDIFIIQPAAATYRFLLPEVVQDSVRNVTRNLNTPVVFANELFQGKTDRASSTITRFAINSTVGVLGIIDVAEDWGYPYYNEDFGQTLGVYDVGAGPYLVLPIFGPSSVRDGFGLLVDAVLDPWEYALKGAGWAREDRLAFRLTRAGLEGIDLRSRNIETLDELRRDSVDYYARIRSLYLQSRASKINSAKPPGNPPKPEDN